MLNIRPELSSNGSMTLLASELQCKAHDSKIVLSLETYNSGHLSEDHSFWCFLENSQLDQQREQEILKSGACKPHSGANVWHTLNKLKDVENNNEVLLKVRKKQSWRLSKPASFTFLSWKRQMRIHRHYCWPINMGKMCNFCYYQASNYSYQAKKCHKDSSTPCCWG